MIHTTDTYVLDILDAAGQLIRSVELDETAFIPCYEDLLFRGICAGTVPNTDRFPTATVEPCRPSPESPYLTGITIHLPPVTQFYGLAVFADLAYSLERPPAEHHEVAEAELAGTVLWRLRATPRHMPSARRPRVTVRRVPYPLHREPLEAWHVPHLTVSPRPFELYVSTTAITELREDAVRSLHVEQASILTGRVIQDPDGLVAVLVTRRTPATVEAKGTAASFSFSPLTFAAARAESVARDPSATILGWAHNHPACQDCPRAEPYCQSETVFFSLADRLVHRTSFAAPYSVALVLGKGRHKSPADPIVRAYAWNHGTITEHPMHMY
jgi:hypothetical protein